MLDYKYLLKTGTVLDLLKPSKKEADQISLNRSFNKAKQAQHKALMGGSDE